MSHATEEQLVETYYGSGEAWVHGHLKECRECHAEFRRLQETLDAVSDYPVPDRAPGYGREVWARVQSQVLAKRPRFRQWIFGAAMAAALALAFVAGTFVERSGTRGQETASIMASSEIARKRVLLLEISDHLERSQIVLTELAHADPKTADLTAQRKLAEGLLDENRLLRARAAHAGDLSDAMLLEDVQRVLLDIANGPADGQAADLEAVQRRIEDQSLLFKVRIMSVDARRKGRSL